MAALGVLGWASLIATAGSAAVSYQQSKTQDKNDRIAAEANAKRANAAAKEAEAAGQHQANEARRKADIMASRALAVAAASGAGTSGIESLMAGIAESGEQAAGVAKYQATESAKGYTDKAAMGINAAERYAAKSRVDRSAMVLGSAVQGASIYDKYSNKDR